MNMNGIANGKCAKPSRKPAFSPQNARLSANSLDPDARCSRSSVLTQRIGQEFVAKRSWPMPAKSGVPIGQRLVVVAGGVEHHLDDTFDMTVGRRQGADVDAKAPRDG